MEILTNKILDNNISEIHILCNVSDIFYDYDEDEEFYDDFDFIIGYTTLNCSSCYFYQDSLFNIDILYKALLFNNSLKNLELSYIKTEYITLLLKILKVNNSLKILNLRFNKHFIKDISFLCKVLKVNNCLEVLYLGDNKIENITPLCEVLENNKSLKELDLSNNEIKDITLLSKVLEVNKSLQKLDLSNNEISDEDKEKLKKIAELKDIEIIV